MLVLTPEILSVVYLLPFFFPPGKTHLILYLLSVHFEAPVSIFCAC